MKSFLKKAIISGVNSLRISSRYIGSPKGFITVKEWVNNHSSQPGVFYTELTTSKEVKQAFPFSLEQPIHNMYVTNAVRKQQAAFVAGIPKGRIWGRNGAVITPDDMLLGDVSREFGRYGGVFNKDHSIFRQIKLAGIQKIRGTVAIVASAGSYNYHHWLYDTLPRIGLLKKAGYFDKIDYFVIDYTGLPFQKESLQVLGIETKKIICCNDNWKFHIEAEFLLVPSLPAALGTICDWTVDFLRDTFLPGGNKFSRKPNNIYLSRKKAPTRKLLNEEQLFEQELKPGGFIEFFAEDYSISETAEAFAKASFIAGIHGSGFANLAFCSEGTRIIDIVAPRHIDAYYWMLAGYTHSLYGYIFGKGERAGETEDLVKHKTDHDIHLDIDEFRSLVQLMKNHVHE